MAGNREEDWGKEKKFREGQAEQVLDTLFFDFIDLAKKLQPKVVIAENVKGLLIGEARSYVSKIYEAFDAAGYIVQYWLLDSSTMGVPQRRERVFFVAMRKDLADPFLESIDMFTVAPKLQLKFNETKIKFNEFYQPGIDDRPLGKGKIHDYWNLKQEGDKSFSDALIREYGRNSCFNLCYLHLDDVSPTYTANGDCLYLFNEYRKPNKFESSCIGSYPQDYNFCKSQYHYLIGMSVPPVMTAQVAKQVYEQWLSKINK
jgi:DNA (cytosine-5)-methyltransferase 1